MGLWTQNTFRVITDAPLPTDYFGKAYKESDDLQYRRPDGTITPREVFEKALKENMKQWEYIEAHEDEFLLVGEGHTLQYVCQNREIGYTFLNKPQTGYETIFCGATPDTCAEENMNWFVNKCKKIHEDTGANIEFMHAKCRSDLNGLYECKNESIGCDLPFEERFR